MSRTLFDESQIPPLPKLVEGFMEYLRAEKNASPHTTLNYDIDLRHWFKFLYESSPGPFHFSKLSDLKILREYLSQAREKYSKTTIHRRLSVIKSFLKYLHREGYIEKNVAGLIRLPRAENKIPDILRPEQMLSLIEGMPTRTLKEKRTRSLMELLYSTGLRVSEVASLTYDHVDFRQGTLRVIGKGNKERAVPLGRLCQTALKDYVDSIPQTQKTGGNTPLFMNRDAGPISVRSIQRTVQEAAIHILGEAGHKVTPHLFRHSCASHLLSRGAGLREIQELLGHRSLVTTQKYTQVDIEHLREAVKKSHPMEKKRRDKET